jgi:hypothetical protein
MNTSKYLVASIGAAIWLFIYSFVANVIVLGNYWQTSTSAGLMRADEDQIMWAISASMLVQALALGYIFTRNYEHKGVGEGVRFGLLIAAFVAGLYLLFYGIQPWALTSTFIAMISDGIGYVGVGVVLSLLYKN